MSFTDDGYDETGVFNALFEAIEDGAWLLDKEGLIMDVNASALKLLGYEESDLIGEQINEFTPDPGSAETFEKAWALTNEDDKTRFETFLLCSDNSVVSIEMNCHFMGGGEAGQILASCRALDHRKKVETAIERRTDNYREILDKSPDGFLLMTPKGKIIETNDAYAKLVGYTKDEILQMNYYELVIGKNGEAKTNSLAENSLFNNYHRTKTGDIVPVEVKVRQFTNKNGVDKILMFIHKMNNIYYLVDLIKKERVIMEKILAGITNQDSTGVLIAKNDIGICYANDFICEVLGYTKKEIFDLHHLFFLMNQDDPEGHIETYTSVLSGDKQHIKITPLFKRKDGSIFQTDMEMTNHKDKHGKHFTLLLFENFADVDENLFANPEKKDENLTKVVKKFDDKCEDALIFLRTDKGVIYTNMICNKAFGYRTNEMIGFKAPNIIHFDHLGRMVKKSFKIYAGFTAEENVECRFKTKGGGAFKADVVMSKHKEERKKYIIMKLKNIVHENAVETVS
ncbi:MAG: PAS domain S-box protein [Leptospirales bacterium]